MDSLSPIRRDSERHQDDVGVDNTDRAARVRVKNRRNMYLDRHPSYFTSPDLELADPLLYDRCVRRFQSAAEREAEGRSKGYSGVLEADLYRSEAKLAALADSKNARGDARDSSIAALDHEIYSRGSEGQILPEDPDEIPATKEEGMKRWNYQMRRRFLEGKDDDFSYEEVDNNDEWDVVENREAEERWFDDEEPEWFGEDGHANGETGIQDF